MISYRGRGVHIAEELEIMVADRNERITELQKMIKRLSKVILDNLDLDCSYCDQVKICNDAFTDKTYKGCIHD